MERVLFCWFRPAPPFFIGGAEVSQQILAERLVASGYDVIYLGSYTHPRNIEEENLQVFADYLDNARIPFRCEGFPTQLVYRYKGVTVKMIQRANVLSELEKELVGGANILFAAQETADKVVTTASKMGAKTVGWLHSPSAVGLLALRGNPSFALATSQFVKRRALEVYEFDSHVFYPPFVYNPVSSEGCAITLINPVPEKGVDTFFYLADAFPKLEFLAVETWYPVDFKRLQAPPNVKYIRRRMDLSSVWRCTRILLVPSRIEEGFPRVVIEAGMSGIPTIASAKGGLPEAVGQGGFVVPTLEPQAWVSALGMLLENAHTFETLSAHACENANRYVRDEVQELKSFGILL